MAENNKLSVTVLEKGLDDNLKKFQMLLAYFVWHLEYVNGNCEGGKKFPAEPQKTIPDKRKAGKGYKNNQIQKQISAWEMLTEGRVFITIGNAINSKIGLYTSTDSYLHWEGKLKGNASSVSIYASWQKGNIAHIQSLYIEDKWNSKKSVLQFNSYTAKPSLKKLGIIIQTDSNDVFTGVETKLDESIISNLDAFYNAFVYAAGLEIKDVLDRTNAKNIIYTGAPGTGKTYLAKQIAKIMGAETEFVQFHPSYDYTDFVEGLRPKDDNGNIVFERKDGIFKEFCKKALNEQKRPYVFIIDEINRGEISKIFGELFFSIDPDYRGEKGKVRTQYQNMIPKGDEFEAGFYVPENVYIIGTMNDIDRSVESMDFAFRRRFTFKEIKAKDTQAPILDGICKETLLDSVKKAMDNLNDAISSQEGFSDAYHIGGVYFRHCKDYKDEDKTLEKLWDNHIKGVLEEYLRGRPDKKTILQDWKKAYDSKSEEINTPNEDSQD